MNRKIDWVKFALPSHSASASIEEDDDDDEKSPWEEKEAGHYKFPSERLESLISGNKILQTPLGSVHLDGSEQSNKLFNVWICVTNFNLTPVNIASIEHLPGVEAFQPISRYRFQIAIGYLFDENEVKKLVEETLLGSLRKDLTDVLTIYQLTNRSLTKTMTEKLKQVTSLIGDSKMWVSLVYPNGEVELLVTDEITDKFFEDVTIMGMIQSFVGGTIDSSLLRE